MSVTTRDLRTYVTQDGFNEENQNKQLARATNLTHIVIGRGVLADSELPAQQTQMLDEIKRFPVNRLVVDPDDAGVLIVEALIPADEGGWTIGEAGVLTEAGTLYAYARQLGDYKPLLSQGQGQDYLMRLKFIPTNASDVELKIDPAVVMASRAYVDSVIESLASRGATGRTQLELGTAAQANVGDLALPRGIITMWSGSNASIPAGWALCNGSNGTPDLRNRFIVGSGSSYVTGNKGGANSVTPTGSININGLSVGATTLSAAQMPSHNHTSISHDAGATGWHNSMYRNSSGRTGTGVSTSTGGNGSHSHSMSGSASFTGATTENRPLYYAIAYIMKS